MKLLIYFVIKETHVVPVNLKPKMFGRVQRKKCFANGKWENALLLLPPTTILIVIPATASLALHYFYRLLSWLDYAFISESSSLDIRYKFQVKCYDHKMQGPQE